MTKNKKIILIICIVIAIVFGGLYVLNITFRGDVSDVNRVVTSSEVFSEQEIQSAMDAVEKEFQRTFTGCKLLELRFHESYQEYTYNGKEAIVLKSDFYVGPTGSDGSLSINSEYPNWCWILVRDSREDKWYVATWGYG